MDRLTGITQNYAWGSQTLLAELRGVGPSGEREAEIWYGAHDAAPSLLGGGRTLLSDIQSDAARVLGDEVVGEHGAKLPFLLKLLAAAEPLSIQAHPTREQAKRGFARENEAGVAVNARHRSFRDDAPKPELIAALTPFEALVGFRPLQLTVDYLSSVGADTLEHVVKDRGFAAAVRWALAPTTAEREAVDSEVATLVKGAANYRGHQWAAEAALVVTISKLYPGDPGILIAALLNRVQLEPGEAVFLDAGTLHAYIGGLGVEIMGNSDNVLRGGLTKKNVDTENLLDVLHDEATEVEIITPDLHGIYQTPASEFRLSRVTGQSPSISGPAIILAVEGTTNVDGQGQQHVLNPTEAVWLGASEMATVTTSDSCFVAVVGG